MELKCDSEKKKEKLAAKNGADSDILRTDEAFWHKNVKNLAQISEQISESKDENSENVSK